MEIVYNLDQWKIFLEGVFFFFFLNKVKHLFIGHGRILILV